MDIVDGFAAHEGVDAAGVVADHAAEGAAAVGGWVGGEGEVVLFGGVAELIEDDAGLDAGEAGRGVEGDDPVHVFGEVEDDGYVAALAGEGGATAAGEDGAPCSRQAAMVAMTSSVERGGRGRWGPGGSWRRRWRRGRGTQGRTGPRRERWRGDGLQGGRRRRSVRAGVFGARTRSGGW